MDHWSDMKSMGWHLHMTSLLVFCHNTNDKKRFTKLYRSGYNKKIISFIFIAFKQLFGRFLMYRYNSQSKRLPQIRGKRYSFKDLPPNIDKRKPLAAHNF